MGSIAWFAGALLGSQLVAWVVILAIRSQSPANVVPRSVAIAIRSGLFVAWVAVGSFLDSGTTSSTSRPASPNPLRVSQTESRDAGPGLDSSQPRRVQPRKPATNGDPGVEDEKPATSAAYTVVENSPAARTSPPREDPPPVTASVSSDAELLGREWKRIDLPDASVEFPETPTRKTKHSDPGTGLVNDKFESLVYTFVGSGVELQFAETNYQSLFAMSAQDRLAGMRAGMIRAYTGTIVKDKKGRKGRFRTMTLELAVDANGVEKIALIEAAMYRGNMLNHALGYTAIAIWPAGDENREAIGRRFVASVRLSR